MAEQLWSDERIEQEMRRIGGGTRLYIDDAATVGKQIRDDLQAALDAANETVAELQGALNGMRGIAQQRMDRVRELERELKDNDRRIIELEARSTNMDRIYDMQRNELAEKQRHILRLEVQAEWEPLPDGEYETQHESCKVHVQGEWLNISDELYDVSVEAALPDNIRLCRRKEQP